MRHSLRGSVQRTETRMLNSEQVVLWAGVAVVFLIGVYLLLARLAVQGITPRPDNPAIDPRVAID